ncbi:death inducer-obliterator 1 [Biomphalaria glabrata]
MSNYYINIIKGDQPISTSDVANASCFNRCDESSSICSCSIMCRIEKNCCEDYMGICFEHFNTNIANYLTLLDLVKECKYSTYLIISECPSEKRNSQIFDSDNAFVGFSQMFDSNNASIDFSQMFENLANGTHTLVQLFQQVPVTDLETGFTFKNISIYQCHEMSERQSLFWNVFMENFGHQSGVGWQFNPLSEIRFEVFPPSVGEAEGILKCSDKKKMFYQTAPSKYEYIHSDYEILKGRPIDHYCDLCSTGNEVLKKNYETEELKRLQGTYPVVTSYMPWNNTFKLELVPNLKEYENILWKSMTCSNLNTKENNVSSVCKIDLCNKKVWTTEKGECKYLHHLKLAVLEEELISTTFVNQLTFYVECYLTLYAGYEIVNMWNDTKIFYNPRFEKMFYVTDYIVLSDSRIYIHGDNDEMLLHFTHYAKLIQTLSGIRAGMATKDLQKPPGLRSIGSLILEDLDNMHFVYHYFTVPTINTLNGTKRQILPVCANLYPISSYLRLQHLDPLCVYVLKNGDMADVKTTELNSCQNIFTFSNYQNHCSRIIIIVFCLSLLMYIDHIYMIKIYI